MMMCNLHITKKSNIFASLNRSKMKKMLFAFMIIVMSVSIYAQTASNTIFSNGDEINIILSGESDYHYVHQMQKGQGLYGLSKVFNVPLKRLYQINNLDPEATIALGQSIKIPVDDSYLFKGINLTGLKFGHYIPVYYQTQPKDNLFRISRVYFNQPTADLVQRNNLKSNNLALGQKLLVGWFPIDKASSVLPEEEFEEDFDEPEVIVDSEIITTKNPLKSNTLNNDTGLEIELDSTLYTEAPTESRPDGFNTSLLGALVYSQKMQEIKKSEVANWDKSMPDNGTVYVLHKNAIIDSYVEMYNPNLKRSVRAKVIGRIPYGAYTGDVNLVLSPRAAKQLGALDNRFNVEVKALVYENI